MKLTKPKLLNVFERAVYRSAISTLEKNFPPVKRVLRGRLPDDIQVIDEPPTLVMTVGRETHRFPLY